MLVTFESCSVKNVLVLDQVLKRLDDLEDALHSWIVHSICELTTFCLFIESLDKSHHEPYYIGGSEENVLIEVLNEDIFDFKCLLLLVELKVEDFMSEHIIIA